MKTKPRKAIHGRSVKGELIVVTDLTEFAELERRVRAAEKEMAKRDEAINAKRRRPRKRR